MNAEELVRRTIKEHALINRGDKVILGLSGGPDSLCLLHILGDLREELGFELSSLHLNHRIRGAAADEDAAWIEAHCRGLGISVQIIERDVPALAMERGMGEEEAGRYARHKLLRAAAQESGAKIALAHNRDDQAETVLLRILRGTGVHGLAAMEYMRADGLIRPLLDTPRSAVENYCRRNALKPRVDLSNAETDYARNRVRLELLPEMESYNPGIKEALVRLASNAYDDDSCLSDAAAKWYAENVRRNGALPVNELRGLPKALFIRVIRTAFESKGLDTDIAAVHIDSLRAAVLRPEGGKTIEFPHGYEAFKRGGLVYFRRNCEKLKNNRP